MRAWVASTELSKTSNSVTGIGKQNIIQLKTAQIKRNTVRVKLNAVLKKYADLSVNTIPHSKSLSTAD